MKRQLMTAIIAVGLMLGMIAMITRPVKAAVNWNNTGQKWHWDGTGNYMPDYNQTMMSPVVADINNDGIPEVIFSTFDIAGGYGLLRAVRGTDGSEVPNFAAYSHTYLVDPRSSIAVGDINGDNYPEILAVNASGNQVMCFDHTGTHQWNSSIIDPDPIDWGGPVIANLYQSTYPQIIVGRTVLDYQGHVIWKMKTPCGMGAGEDGPLSAVANLDMTGYPEVVAGNTSYTYKGDIFWQSPIPDGFPGVADFDLDGYPEVVVVRDCYVYLLNGQTGAVINSVHLDSSHNPGRGGAPTIADFNSDDKPEIGVATNATYTMISHMATTPTVEWTAPIQDFSSGMACASAFDFDGDGNAEIVYADENNIYIMSGLYGTFLWWTARSSGTTYEMPAIADIDNDYRAEIVVCANNYAAGGGGEYGLIAYGNPSFLPTRPVWNQHTYHITNILDNGKVPVVEPNNWKTPSTHPYNNYRCQPITTIPPVRVPVGGVSVPVEVTLPVSHAGLAPIITVAAAVIAATAVYVKRVKRRKEKQ
jgi:hypothetical protein